MIAHFKRVLCVFVSLIMLILNGCSRNSTVESFKGNGYPWIDEQYLVDCAVVGEKVQFRYAMTYHNNSEYDIGITHISCSFDSKELSQWYGSIKDEPFQNIQSGFVENENGEAIIPAGETQVIVFVFEGEYLGGILPDALSKPEGVIWGEHVYSAPSKP